MTKSNKKHDFFTREGTILFKYMHLWKDFVPCLWRMEGEELKGPRGWEDLDPMSGI